MNRLKAIACGALLAVVVMPADLLAESMLLRNPSFELPKAGASDEAESWFRWGDWINRETDWTPVYDGQAILAYHHWRIQGDADSGIWQDLEAVEKGVRYAFSIRANADLGAEGASASEVELRLESTVDGRQVIVNSRRFPVEFIAQGDQWSKLEVSGTAANDTLRVLVLVYPAGDEPRDGAVKFDGAELIAATWP